jgi:ATP-dependent DNA helicase RecG
MKDIIPLSELPVTAVSGVGEDRRQLLERLKIITVQDLLFHQPRRHEDRRKFLPIRELKLKEAATVRGRVVAAGFKRWQRGARSLFECIFEDGTARLHCRWWHSQPWMEDWYAVGREFLIYGKPQSLKPINIDHPETELVEPGDDEFIHVNRIVPFHPLTEGLTGRVMRSLIWRALEQFSSRITEPDFLIAVESNANPATPFYAALPTRASALHMIHFPEEMADVEIGRRRLALDEFVLLQLAIQGRRKKFEAQAQALPCGGDNHWMKPFLSHLGFKLTEAQTRVLREIRTDLSGPHPMRRLLQGDVGSGKTAVAACAALMALESGFNVALMAPTEILAEQHFQNFSRWFSPLGIAVRLQTGRSNGIETEPAGASVCLHIGTHALLTSGFALPKLGLVVIDEQHKFGVSQREQLVRKGRYPHLLVMTATPIPRTLGLTLYGDLDISVIDEIPGGRGQVQTFVRTADKLPKVWEFIREKLAAGRQAFVVYPRAEQDEADIKAVTKEFAGIQRALPSFKVGLLHGKLKGPEKDATMAGFRAGQIQVLLATSLIEVGVDVPNATVMLVENAERFGLAQLHQLRGRIGRGAHDSFCILISAAGDPEAQSRLAVMAKTNDGFKIAEADLKIRGPGELLGQQQSGLPDLRFGRLVEDADLVRQSREIAACLLRNGSPS